MKPTSQGMSPESTIDVLRAHLAREGLTLCRNADTTFPLDGVREVEALREIAVLVHDTGRVSPRDEWSEGPTKEIPVATLDALRRRAA